MADRAGGGRFFVFAGDNRNRRASLTALIPTRAYGSYGEMFAEEKQREDGIDFVVIATPNSTHLPIARAALEAGVPGPMRAACAIRPGWACREDKAPADVVREVPAPATPRHPQAPRPARIVQAVVRAKPRSRPRAGGAASLRPRGDGGLRAARPGAGGVRLTHADRELWPGISKQALAEYWRAVAGQALPEIAHRPLALVRCPEGIAGEHFFQKHARPGFPPQIRAGEADGAPFLAIDDVDGLLACAQVSAIELHAWGAGGDDPLHPDRLVFDLDPGEGIGMAELVQAAREVRERLERAGLAAFCRTSGGKGLHVVVPLAPGADWDTAARLVPRLRRGDGGGAAGPLRLPGAEGETAASHPDRLAAQRARRHRDRQLFAARAAGRRSGDPAGMARRDAPARPRRLHADEPCRGGWRGSAATRGRALPRRRVPLPDAGAGVDGIAADLARPFAAGAGLLPGGALHGAPRARHVALPPTSIPRPGTACAWSRWTPKPTRKWRGATW